MEKTSFGSALWKVTKEAEVPTAVFAWAGPIAIGIAMAQDGLNLTQVAPSVIMVGAMYVIGSRVNEIVSEPDLKVG